MSLMQLCHLVLVRPLGRFPVGITSRTCLANLSRGILVTCPNHRSWDVSVPVRLNLFSTTPSLSNCPLFQAPLTLNKLWKFQKLVKISCKTFSCCRERKSSCPLGIYWCPLGGHAPGLRTTILFGREAARHSEFCEFRSCVSVTPWTLPKLPSLPLELGIAFFQSLSEIHDHKWGLEQRPA